MAERLNAPVLKTGGRDERLASSNLALSSERLVIAVFLLGYDAVAKFYEGREKPYLKH
jgi:hypothetical protein